MDFKLFFEQIKKFYTNLSKQQKIILFGSIGVLFAGVLFILIESNKVTYAPLFTNLNAKDASDIVTYLNQHGIKYKLEQGGSVIEVPKDEVYSLRLDLVASGLPKHGVVGFEIFNKQSFGTTPFVENVNYIRALEGELTRTIENINEVKSAKVNIAIPKPTIFTEQQQPPTASIVLNLYRPLTRSQVLSIQKLVAAAVPGLSYKDVTIVDSDGNLLSVNESNGQLLTANEIKYKQLIEQQYKQRIQSMLLPILGKDKFVVSVDVNLDLSKVKKKSITYDPNSVVVSEEDEESTSTTPSAKGVPGVVSNIGNNSRQNTPVSKSSKSKTVTNYDVGSTETVTEEPLIKIKNVSVAVVVDGIYKPTRNKKGKVVGYKFEPLPKTTLNNIQQAVMSAIGYSKDRGDRVTVTCMKFASFGMNEGSGGGVLNGGRMVINFASYYKYALIALLLAIFYFLFLRKFIKNVITITTGKVEEKESGEKSEGEGESEALEEESVKGKTIREIEEEIASKLEEEEVVDEEKIRSSMMEDKIREAASSNPEEVANLIKTILLSKPKG